MKQHYFFIMLCMLFFSNSSYSAEREYRSHIETADWKTEGKEQAYCLIKQEIPYYGEAIFRRKSGNEVVFELTSQELFLKETKIIIMGEPAPWRQNITSFKIGSFNMVQGHKPLTVRYPYSSRMFQHVENGLMPTITYKDVADQRDIITIAVSPVNFRKHLKVFRQCESTLLEYDPDFIKDFDVFFATNKSKLTDRGKKYLNYVVKHLKIDKSIKQIRIDAHADSIGRRRSNDRLSDRRAKAVKGYLIKIGADEKIIDTMAHGERKPKHTNENALGRSKNRHARIQLLNTPPITVVVEVDSKKAPVDKEKLKPTKGITPPVPNFINLEHLITK
jgi:sodium-type flagellar protein MotY